MRKYKSNIKILEIQFLTEFGKTDQEKYSTIYFISVSLLYEECIVNRLFLILY